MPRKPPKTAEWYAARAAREKALVKFLQTRAASVHAPHDEDAKQKIRESVDLLFYKAMGQKVH